MAAARASDLGPTDDGDSLVEAVNDAAKNNSGRTGQISAFLMCDAIRNFWPAPLLHLSEGLVRDREDEARITPAKLCGLGRSSGADIATGFLFGLECLVFAS